MSATEVDGKLLRVAAFLRKSPAVRTNECIMAEKRVDVFKGATATKALLSPAYAALHGVPKITSHEEATTICQELLNSGLILRARSVNNTRFFQPDLSRTWSDDALYAWLYDGSQYMTILGAATLLVVVLGFMLFPLWPHVIRSKASWVLNIVMYLAIGMIGFLIALSIVRMIVYLITYFTVKPGIWIFPNLWEDVGIIESFIPLWDWDKPPASRPSRSSQATASTAESTDAPKESNN